MAKKDQAGKKIQFCFCWSLHYPVFFLWNNLALSSVVNLFQITLDQNMYIFYDTEDIKCLVRNGDPSIQEVRLESK